MGRPRHDGVEGEGGAQEVGEKPAEPASRRNQLGRHAFLHHEMM